MQPHSSIQSLITVTERPWNAETPLAALDSAITPAALVYIRCNFDIPVVDPTAWQLSLDGAFARPAVLSLDRLRALPYHEVHAAMECAGNGRAGMRPVPAGTPWGLGAVSNIVFGGTPLRAVLEECGLEPSAVELVFEGADRGPVATAAMAAGAAGAAERTVKFARSLPREQALHADALIAWTLNGAPLEPAHGYPLRLFVPGWYGVASVKWLTRITAVHEPFAGHFQADSYIYDGHPDYAPGTPVTFMHVRSLIAAPAEGTTLRAGSPVRISGVAWSGFGGVRRVELSSDGGASWSPARLRAPSSPWAATHWDYDWTPSHAGEYVLMARAEDSTGARQPVDPVWNRLGYGNNAVHRVAVSVTAA